MGVLRLEAKGSTPGGFPGTGLNPGVELLPGVGASVRGVGVLDFDTGVVDFSLRLSSFDLEEGVLLEDAIEAGLTGASFLSKRVLSRPFSLGECAGLPRGDDGSSLETSTTKLSSLFSPSLS